MKKPHFWHDALLVASQVLISLLIFILVISIVVFLFRKPLRKYKYIDLAVFTRVSGWTNARRNKIILLVTFLGNHLFLIPANILVILYFIFIRKHTWFSVRVAAISISSLVLMLLLKALFRRKRPLNPLLKAARGLSFPSGHAIMSVTFYGLIIYILCHTVDETSLRYIVTGFLVILILFIGFSRVYLRVHYASDVMAGFIIGLLWLLISLAVVETVEKSIATLGY